MSPPPDGVFVKIIRITGRTEQLGAAANFDDLVKFGDRRQIRQSQMFIKLAFEFGCDAILMSHPITRSLASKLR